MEFNFFRKITTLYLILYEEKTIKKTRKRGFGNDYLYRSLNYFEQSGLIIKTKKGRNLSIKFTENGNLFYKNLKKLKELMNNGNNKRKCK